MPSTYRMAREQASRVAVTPCHLAPPLGVKWTLPSEGVIHRLPFVEDGLVFAFDYVKDRLLGMEEATAKVRWKASRHFALIHDGVGLSWRQTGGHAVDLQTGQTLRPLPFGWGQVIVRDHLVASASDVIRVASISEGRDLWEHKPEGPYPPISGVFCADERAVYSGLSDCSVMALSLQDGRVLWRQPKAGVAQAEAWDAQGYAVLHGDTVIFRFPPNIAGVSAVDGRVLWQTRILSSKDGYLYDGRYYVVTWEGEYHILEPETGRVLVSADLNATLPSKVKKVPPKEYGPLLVSETHAFVGTDKGWLLAFERETGKYAWSIRPSKASITDGPGYFASANGRLYYATTFGPGKEGPCLYCLEEEEATDPVLIEQRARLGQGEPPPGGSRRKAKSR